MNKKVKFIIVPACVLLMCWLLFRVTMSCIFFVSIYFQTHSDVAKRIKSPDNTKVALLIRREAFIDLNFFVDIKEGVLSRSLHKSRDFLPDQFVDWNEKLVWSYDSSFLVMSVDNEFDNEAKYMWAYDFKDDKEYTDEAAIMEILSSRNEGKENPIEAMYKF